MSPPSNDRSHTDRATSETNRKSLFDRQVAKASAPDDTPGAGLRRNTLVDLFYDGFYLLFMLHNGHLPASPEEFAESMRRYFDEFEQQAKKQGKSADDIYASKYAMCAAVDETVLAGGPHLRDYWELRPLQLQLFGDHLAGEHFFDQLEQLRAEGKSRLEVLEVYYLCLLLGFKGKFALEGSEKLGYMTARTGDEIASMKGRRAGFAPHWEPPDSITHVLKREVPAWVVASVCALVGLLALMGLNYSLSRSTEIALNKYHGVVELPPSAAHLTITLP